MKKSIIIAAALAITSVGAFAQGNVQFGGNSKGIWNDYTTPGSSVLSAGIDVAMLFFTTSPTALNAISSTGSATNGSTVYTPLAAWTALENGSTAVNGPSSSSPAVGTTIGNGGFTYNTATAWSASNVTGGTTYFAVEVAWNTDGGTITTLSEAEAAAATDQVGWSSVFNYTPSTGANPAPGWSASITPFSVGGVTTPEPGTMALAAIGGASLLMFRRKK